MTTKRKKKATNVVPFTGKQDEKFVPRNAEEALEYLTKLDDLEYEHSRRILAEEWDGRVERLDRWREEAVRRQREYYWKKNQPEYEQSHLEKECGWILDAEGILDLFVRDWEKVMAGEHRNAKLLFLIATSRLFENPMHVAIKGPSSAGKSQIRKLVLKFFPEEDVIQFTALSEKALIWEEREFCNKILSMAEATDSKSQELQDMLLRELMSEGVLRYRAAQVSGRVQTIEIVKRGPVSFMVTTTKAALHPENETRMISLEVDDSEEQTRRVLKKQAQTFGRNNLPDASIYEPWQSYQRLLRVLGRKRAGGWLVDVPFAAALAALIPPRATRLRRDYPQVLSCIKAHCLLHFSRRKWTEDESALVADLELDYAPVAELIGHIASEGAGVAVSKELMETINAVKQAAVGIPADDGATAYEVSKKLGLDPSTVHRRLGVAISKGFVVNMQQRKFQPGKYRLTDQEVQAESLLPTVEEVRAYEAPLRRKGSGNDASAQAVGV
jgi:hypothetical protein